MGALGLETSKRRKGGFSLEVYNLQCLTVNHLCSHSQMEVTLRLKFTQHADLRAMLLGTRDAELVEVRCLAPITLLLIKYLGLPKGLLLGSRR